MDLETCLSLPAAEVVHDVRYLPKPNRVETVICDGLPPPDLVRTAFVFGFLRDGTLLMAVNRKRGPEIPGGHIEYGETALQAAIRELVQETGSQAEEASIAVLGFLRMISDGDAPEGWQYPHPVGFQQFFTGLVPEPPEDYAENEECLAPVRVSRWMAIGPDSPIHAGQLAFYRAAHRAIFGCAVEDMLDGTPSPGHAIP